MFWKASLKKHCARKISVLESHEILLLFIYIVYYLICQLKNYVNGLMTLICLPGLVWLLCLGLILFFFYLNFCDQEDQSKGREKDHDLIVSRTLTFI